jgi:hypothetical protein
VPAGLKLVMDTLEAVWPILVWSVFYTLLGALIAFPTFRLLGLPPQTTHVLCIAAMFHNSARCMELAWASVTASQRGPWHEALSICFHGKPASGVMHAPSSTHRPICPAAPAYPLIASIAPPPQLKTCGPQHQVMALSGGQRGAHDESARIAAQSHGRNP